MHLFPFEFEFTERFLIFLMDSVYLHNFSTYDYRFRFVLFFNFLFSFFLFGFEFTQRLLISERDCLHNFRISEPFFFLLSFVLFLSNVCFICIISVGFSFIFFQTTTLSIRFLLISFCLFPVFFLFNGFFKGTQEQKKNLFGLKFQKKKFKVHFKIHLFFQQKKFLKIHMKVKQEEN